MKYDDVPWTDTTKWKPGCWYPLPVSSIWTDPDKCTVVEGYDIFMKDPDADFDGDIIPAGKFGGFTFLTAVRICETHNKWSFEIE